MDYGLIFPQPAYAPDKKENVLYKSHKFTLSNGKIYPSIAAYRKDLSINKLEPEILSIIDCEEFWKEAAHFMLLEKC